MRKICGLLLTFCLCFTSIGLTQAKVDYQSYFDNYPAKLAPKYDFPTMKQSLNACYFFSVRNIMKYKYDVGIYIPRVLEYIGFSGKSLSSANYQEAFLKATNISITTSTSIKTFFEKMNAGEPLAISYMLSYKDKKGKDQTVAHVAVAYSYDKDGIRVSDSYSASKKRVARSEVFSSSGVTKYRPLRMFSVKPYTKRTQAQKDFEKDNNFLKNEKSIN